VFIPTVNDEIPPSAEKYRKQAHGFYEQFMAQADVLLSVADPTVRQAAHALTERNLQTRPSALFRKLS
jgi:hypothetical protein